MSSYYINIYQQIKYFLYPIKEKLWFVVLQIAIYITYMWDAFSRTSIHYYVYFLLSPVFGVCWMLWYIWRSYIVAVNSKLDPGTQFRWAHTNRNTDLWIWKVDQGTHISADSVKLFLHLKLCLKMCNSLGVPISRTKVGKSRLGADHYCRV